MDQIVAVTIKAKGVASKCGGWFRRWISQEEKEGHEDNCKAKEVWAIEALWYASKV